MSHSLRPKSERRSTAPNLPKPLAAALEKVRKDVVNLEAWEELNQLCREQDRPDEAAALYTTALEQPLGEALEDVGRLAVDFCEEWYEDPAPTLEMLGAVLSQDVNQAWAFERLTVLLTVASEWDALLRAYDKALEGAADPLRKQALLEEAAKVARDFAGKPERASDYLKDLLLLRLDDEQLAVNLERRFDEQGRHLDLIEIWTARLSVIPREAALRTRLQIAARYVDALSDGANALLSIERFLEAGGAVEEACAVLERLADAETAELGVRRGALALLDKLYTAKGKWLEVISVTERALVLSETEQDRVRLHAQAVELYSRLENFEEALRHCGEILQITPEADEVRIQAKELAERIGRLDTYANFVVVAADSAEGARRVELLIESARVRRATLGDAVGAIDLYFRVEKDEEADQASRLLACQELSELLFAAERSEELLAILETRADLETEGSERRRILGEAALLATSLGQGERALGLWSLRLNDDSADDEALSAKIDLFEGMGKHQGLVQALLARADVGDDKERQRADLVRAAAVHSERLHDLGSAIEVWRTVEERVGRTHETLDSLVALSAEAKRYEDVVKLLREAISQGSGDARVVQQLGQLGDTQRLYLQENAEAFKSYRHALELSPSAAPAISGVRALMLDKDLAHFAGEALASAFRRSGALDQIVELLEMRLASAPDDSFRSKILLEAAGLEEQAGHLSEALSAVARAFTLVPSQPTEAELHRLAAATGDFAAAVSAYQAAISHLAEGSERASSLYSARGKLEEERLSDFAAATESYRHAVELVPDDEQVVRSLIRAGHAARLFGDAAWAVVENSRALSGVSKEQVDYFAEQAALQGDWEGSLEGLADRIASADGLEPQVAHDLKKQLAVWYRDRLGDPDSAEMVLKRAVLDFPQEDSLRVLAELQRRAPGKPLVVTLTALADVCDEQLPVLREAGDVALHFVRDPVLARPLLERALLLAAERFAEAGSMESEEGFEASDAVAWATDHLVRVSLDEGKRAEAVDLLERSALLPFVASEKVSRRFRAGQVAADSGFDEKAVELCEAVLKDESQHEGAITLLSTLHEKAGRLTQLLELRQRELMLERPQERRLFLRLDQARVLGQTGAPAEERILVLQKNLEDLPGHAPSIAALREILLEEKSFALLATVLETQARALSDTEGVRAGALWEEAGTLAETELGDVERLAQDYKLSAAAHPTIAVVDRLAKISEAEEQWEKEVSWLQLRIALTPEVRHLDDPEERRNVVVRLGQALVRSDDWGSARVFLEEELQKDEPADGVRQLLAKIYREVDEWQLLADLLEGGVEFAPNDAAQIEYLRQAAQVERRRLNDLDRTANLLQRALVLDPEDRGLKLTLADTLRVAQRYEPAAELLTGLLEEFGRRRTTERALVHTQLARIAQETGDLERALEQAEAAAKIERTDPEILMLLGQLAKSSGQLEKAEQAYRTLALIVSRKAPSVGEEGGQRVGESAILFELYRIAEEKGDTKQSRELLDSALEVATRSPEEALDLAASLKAAGQVDLLLRALEQRLESGMDGAVAASMLVTKANVLEQSEREREALESRLKALEFSPGDTRLLDSTQKLAERIDAADEFWANVQRLAQANQQKPQVAGELWYRAGRAAETQQEDQERAAEFYELSQKTGHKPKRAFLALDRILDEGSEPERVQASLKRFVSSEGAEASPDVLSDALYRLADFELASGAIEEGATHLLKALEVDAQDERALEMLEPIVRSSSPSERVVILFLRVARKAAKKETLLFAFQAAASIETVEKPVLDEAIALARELDDGVALRGLLSRTIQVGEQNDDLAAVSALIVERASLARNDEEFELEASLLRKAIPFFEGSDRFELELRLAACTVNDLGRRAEGQAAYERLLESHPAEGRVWKTLMVLYRDGGRTDAVEALIATAEEQVTDEADLEFLKMERVRLMVGENRLEEAEAALRATLEERPHMEEAASILAELLRKAERWDELKELVEDLFGRARERGDGALVAKFGVELAQLVAPDERERAMDVLSSGLSQAHKQKAYLEYYLSLYSDEDNQSERSDVMEYLLALESGGRARELAFELYTLRDQLGDDYGAGRALEIGVRVASEQTSLVETYEQYLRAQGEHEKLAEILKLQARQLGKQEAAAQKYAEAARIYDKELGSPELAADAISRAYECDPSNLSYLEQGAQFLVNIGQVDSALAKLKLAIDVGDESAMPDLLELRSNIIRSERSGDRDAMSQAALDIKNALGYLIPEEQEASLQGARVEVLGELRSLHQTADDIGAERGVVLELADTLKKLGDASGSVDTLASWVREHEDDMDVALILGRTATEVGDHSAAMFAYERMLAASEGEAKIDAVLRLADAAEAAGQPMEAQNALEGAFADEPTNERLRDRLRRMYEAAGAYEDLANILLAEADKSEEPEVRSALLVDVGDLYLKAEKGEDACSMYEQALELAEAPYAITSKLALAYVALGELERAKAVLNEALSTHGKKRTPELAVLQHGLSRVAEASGDIEGMFSWLEAALMSDRNNGEVAQELAVRAQESGRYDVAIKALQSLTLSKGDSPMSKGEAYFRQAQIAQAQGDPKKALLMARRAHAAEPELTGVEAFIAELGG